MAGSRVTAFSATDLRRVVDAVREYGSVNAAAVALKIDPGLLNARWRLTKRRLVTRQAQARYQRTEKGRAAAARYDTSPKRQISNERYRRSELGKAMVAACNDRRVYIGRTYRGRAQSAEQASAINRHVKERVRVFKQGQSCR